MSPFLFSCTQESPAACLSSLVLLRRVQSLLHSQADSVRRRGRVRMSTQAREHRRKQAAFAIFRLFFLRLISAPKRCPKRAAARTAGRRASRCACRSRSQGHRLGRSRDGHHVGEVRNSMQVRDVHMIHSNSHFHSPTLPLVQHAANRRRPFSGASPPTPAHGSRRAEAQTAISGASTSAT